MRAAARYQLRLTVEQISFLLLIDGCLQGIANTYTKVRAAIGQQRSTELSERIICPALRP
jgi:hypothetical protein